MLGGAEFGAVTAAMAGHGEPWWGVFGVHGPAEEPVDEQSRGWPAGDPGVDLALADVGERDVALAEPVEEVDRDGDGLLAAQEGAVGDGVHLVHAPQMVPVDIAVNDGPVGVLGQPLQCCVRPVLVADKQLIASGQATVFDQEPAHVVAGARAWKCIDRLVREVREGGQLFQEVGHVPLADPGQSTVGAFHRFQRLSQGDKPLGDVAGVRVGQQSVDGLAQCAWPAQAGAVDLVLGAAAHAIDVEGDLGTRPAGRAPIYSAR
ncbi:hypothetical protein QYN14_27255 (plasmid) [Rhodococcus ruber]|uniref:hypothetical protein n=1 Tax=Rhodococcus ruber TaxID=1830 RepID=UPI0026588554|nr:hypothetical protein [Rhodococcus ruber]WKK14850.1 hypothetical protein QYN14_27255 [Rhodococcus ruber]